MRNLKKIRKLRGLKQKELAEMVGVTESAISQYESGNKVPSFEVALKLAEALDCESADLVSERDILFEQKNPVTESDGKQIIDMSLLNDEQRQLIEDVLKMNAQTRSVALPVLESLVSAQKAQGD